MTGRGGPAPDDDDILVAQLVEHPVEFRPVSIGSRDLFAEDAGAPRLFKSVELKSDFIAGLKREMQEALTGFHEGLVANEYVKIEEKNRGRIRLSPLPVQTEPANLGALKARMVERWSMTSLLDVFKETDLRVRFTDAFRSATARENLDRKCSRNACCLPSTDWDRMPASSA